MSTLNENEVVTEEVVEEVEEDTEPMYELRALASKDVFLMSKIISKIGVNEFIKTFESPEIRKLVVTSFNKDEAAETDAGVIQMAGIGVALEMANILLTNLSSCEVEIYSFLSSLSGISAAEIMELPMNVFVEMVIDVCKKDEFKDFIKVVSKLFK